MAGVEKYDSTSEEGAAASSYVLNFYKDVMSLTHFMSVYKSQQLVLAGNHAELSAGVASKNLSEAESNQIQDTIFNLRYYIDRTRLTFKAIIRNIKIDSESERTETIIKLCKEMDMNFMIKYELIEAYVQEMHDFLLKDVIKGLLKTSQNMIDKVYQV